MQKPTQVSDEQIRADFETLSMIVAGLNRLEESWNDTRRLVHARSRGYFTPDEDDAVRQMLLAYRNYRLTLYEIIHRCRQYPAIGDPSHQLQVFMLGFAAGLTLYSKSLKLIQSYEREPLVRQKLNEPEEKFGLGPGFFEEVLAAYSSPRNYWLLLRGSAFWRSHRRAAKELGLLETDQGKWLADLIRRQRKAIPARLFQVLSQRARYDLRLFWDTTLNPFRRTTYALKTVFGTTFAGARVTLHYRPALTPEIQREFRQKLRPGDILLVRADEKLTAALLPGFWSHAAIYLGSRAELEQAGLRDHSILQQLENLPQQVLASGLVIEAIAPRLAINPLSRSLFGDHVLALRPNLPSQSIVAALQEAFLHLGKPYDFEFDFNVTTRIVCTELVYRAFHKKGGIEFALVKRLGRFTLTGNDIVHYALDNLGNGQAPFDPVALVMKQGSAAHFIPEDQIPSALAQVRGGRSPAELTLSAPVALASPA